MLLVSVRAAWDRPEFRVDGLGPMQLDTSAAIYFLDVVSTMLLRGSAATRSIVVVMVIWAYRVSDIRYPNAP